MNDVVHQIAFPKIKTVGLGAFGDIGCHLTSLPTGFAGPLDSVVREIVTFHQAPPLQSGQGRAEVENEDAV